jgi:hypothetical protein
MPQIVIVIIKYLIRMVKSTSLKSQGVEEIKQEACPKRDQMLKIRVKANGGKIPKYSNKSSF